MDATIRRRNARELVACGLITVGFGAVALLAGDGWVRLAAAGCVLASWWIAGVLLVAGRAADAVDERRQLLRQTRLLSWAPLWYVAPVFVAVVGLSLALDGELRETGALETRTWVVLAVLTVAHAAVAALNVWAAAALRRQADQGRLR